MKGGGFGRKEGESKREGGVIGIGESLCGAGLREEREGKQRQLSDLASNPLNAQEMKRRRLWQKRGGEQEIGREGKKDR